MKAEFGECCVECGNLTHTRCDRCADPVCKDCRHVGIGPTLMHGHGVGVFCPRCTKQNCEDLKATRLGK